jgi:glutathione-specific gamma-glutamylcyclotransferase
MNEAEIIASRRYRPGKGEELSVFAYGSLMWRPDFPFIEIQAARLYGYHRAFCIVSTHYRGTAETPGLVLGLDRGGMCLGRRYRVAAKEAKAVADYLHGREMISGCYVPRCLKVRLEDGSEKPALAFVADRAHRDYAGRLSDDEILACIRRARGKMGTNAEYLRNTVLHLDELGIREGTLHRLLRQLNAGK